MPPIWISGGDGEILLDLLSELITYNWEGGEKFLAEGGQKTGDGLASGFVRCHPGKWPSSDGLTERLQVYVRCHQVTISFSWSGRAADELDQNPIFVLPPKRFLRLFAAERDHDLGLSWRVC